MQAEKRALTEAEIEAFVTKLKQSDNDKKIDQIQLFGLKLEGASEIPSSALDALTLTIGPLLKSSSQLLCNAILNSFIPFYLTLIPTSPLNHLHFASSQFLPVLLEKINDAKERTHVAARTCTALLGQRSYEVDGGGLLGSVPSLKGKEREGLASFWERLVRDATSGKGSRAKIEIMRMLSGMRQDGHTRLPLKPWLAPLVDLLEDSDGGVRDQARETVIALLSPSSTPSAARSEVKKLLVAKNVRKTITDAIISGMFAPSAPVASIEGNGEANDGSRGDSAASDRDAPETIYVANGHDLENEFAKMVPWFEGKETEHNWAQREASIVRIRGLLRGQAFARYPESFMAGLRNRVSEGISKTLLSLRTTVAQQSCTVIQELAEHMKSSFDSFGENLLPVLGKMAGYTKKIIAEKSQRSLTAIIRHCTVHVRALIAHIATGIAEKNIQTRQYSIVHLKTFLDVHGARAKSSIDSTPNSLESIETALRKSLGDVNPQVRESARTTFWSFNEIWPGIARTISDGLDGTAKRQLDKANPKASPGQGEPQRPKATKKPSATSSVAALLAEKRKAKAAELAAGRGAQDVSRVVSSPLPASPVIRGNDDDSEENRADGLNASRGSGNRSVSSSMGAGKQSQETAHSSGQPAEVKEIAAQDRGLFEPQSPASSSNTSGRIVSRTPESTTAELARFVVESPARRNGGASGSGEVDALVDTQVDKQSLNGDELRRQAEEAERAAQEMLDLDSNRGPYAASPITPAKTTTNGLGNGDSGSWDRKLLLRTPPSSFSMTTPSRAAWDDSPRPEAMTPLLFAQLKEKKHQRAWWLKRQQLMEKASPLRSRALDPLSTILGDIRELESGSPSLRCLQKLALFAETYPLADTVENTDESATAWREGETFDRVFPALMNYLSPKQPLDLLEQALVLLWELVRNQWSLFRDREDALVDALFRLRACPNIIIHESVNSLMSLLCDASEAMFLLSVIRSALGRYLAAHPPDEARREGVLTGASAQASGYLFGLIALGRCVLRIPREALRIEAPRLAPVISDALSQDTIEPRKAANSVILAIQAIMDDAQETMDMLELNEGQRDFAFYMLAKNKLWSPPERAAEAREPLEDKAERVKEELEGILGRGSRVL